MQPSKKIITDPTTPIKESPIIKRIAWRYAGSLGVPYLNQ
jgi:hypothetical protein